MDIRYFEIGAVLTTGALKFVLVDILDLKFWFITGASVFWVTYVVSHLIKDPTVLKSWGFRSAGFRPTFKFLSLPSILFLAFTLIFGGVQGYLVFSWHIIPVLVLYPIWGTLQQFLIISLFGGNLLTVQTSLGLKSIILVTALLFAVVHFPSIPLVLGTFVLALGYMYLFEKYKNLWALGLFHGWLGAIFYFFVLGRDPWVEFVGSI